MAVSLVGSGTPEHFTNYGYDNSGRLSTVTSPAGNFTYAYTPNSSLIATVNGPVHTVTNTWEANRDVLDVKENKIPSTSTPISRFDYNVNNIGQRTGVTTSGSAFNSTPADWNWSYDALGQVVTADSPTNTFDRAYQYDQIGSAPSEAWRLKQGESPCRKSPAVRQDGARASPPIRTESCVNEGRRKLPDDICEA